MTRRLFKLSTRLLSYTLIIAGASGIVFGAFSMPALAPTLDIKVLGTTTAEPGTTYTLPQTTPINDQNVKAKSYLVFNQESGAVLAMRAPNTPVSIASITKLMTGYLVNAYDIMGDTVTVSSKNTLDISPSLYLAAGDEVLASDLFNAMIVGSANDAALVLGDYLATKNNKNIADLMNQAAEQLGMYDSRFNNALGFDSDTNYSTAYDLKLLVQAISEYDSFTKLDRLAGYSFTTAQGKQYSVKATNKLISADNDIHAIKTGYTDEAKGAMITAITHRSERFVIIVLNSENREQDTLILKEEIIKAYFP